MMSTPIPRPEQEQIVRKAARTLARAGLVHAYGHCSIRLDAHYLLVCAPRPMGLIGVGEDGQVAPIEGDLPSDVLPEVRIHQAIYQRRSDIGAVCRIMPASVMSLSALGRTPLARIGFGAYFYPQAPLWDDPLLVRSSERANALAAQLGDARAIVMRGNGAVTVGESIEHAVVFAWYLEEAARVELDVLATGLADEAPLFTEHQASVRAVGTGRLYERMWEYLGAGDPE